MKNVKEQIDALSPLSGGIVFGKEEAWDKLQARMDKPARVIVFKYWMAAAAILLLFITVLLTYNHSPVNEVAANKPAKTNTQITIIPQPSQEPTVATIKSPPVTIPVKHNHTIIKKQEQQPIRQEVQIPDIVHAPFIEAPANSPAVAATTPAPISKIPTKVVHINEPDNNPGTEARLTVLTTPSSDMKKTPIVHLNDITDQQDRLNRYLLQRKDNFVVTIPLLNPPADQGTKNNNNENYTPPNPLKFRIN